MVQVVFVQNRRGGKASQKSLLWLVRAWCEQRGGFGERMSGVDESARNQRTAETLVNGRCKLLSSLKARVFGLIRLVVGD